MTQEADMPRDQAKRREGEDPQGAQVDLEKASFITVGFAGPGAAIVTEFALHNVTPDQVSTSSPASSCDR